MQIINAAAENEHNCSEHADDQVQNPAANYGKYHAEFGYQPLNKDMVAPEVPEIKVNGVLIEEQQVLAEMQHHPADSKRSAMIKAAESLIVGELLRQQAVKLNFLRPEAEANSAEEAAGLETLLKKQVPTPEATEQEHLRFFEANQEKFATSPLILICTIKNRYLTDNFQKR